MGTEFYFEEKVKAMFDLSLEEKLLNRYSCYIIGIVTLPGWLYITTQSLCFHALLPETKKRPRKSGYLTKKKRMSSPRSFRYYFELSGHVLSWYESIESRYLPLKSIDLVHTILIEPHKSKRNKFAIRLQTDSDRFLLIADSEISQKEWLDELQKSIFLAQHAGNQMRIVLKYQKIASIEKPMIFQFAENVKVKALEEEGTKDYYFAFFLDINEAYHCIADTWKQASGALEKSATVSPSQSHDSFFNNISLTTFPTVFMHRLMTTQNKSEGEEDEEDEERPEKDDKSATKTRSSRSGSLSTLKHLVTPTYLYNKLSNTQDTNTNNASNHDKQRQRSASIGSGLLSFGSKSWGFLSEREHIDEIWISPSLAKSITPSIMNKSLDLWTKEQESSNKALNDLFPMLLGLENTEAVFKCSVWKTIPHHGRIYMTKRHLCFYSKVTVGKQRLLIPWADVTNLEAVQPKTYLVSCAISMSVKDIKEPLQFDFASAQLRDQCLYICQLKIREVSDTSSIISKDSQRKDIALDGPLPIELPKKYDGPPLLTYSSEITKHLKKTPEQPLHVTCLTIGSRGDVQPYIALCKELKKDGHTCRIATHAEYQEWVESYDIEFRCIGGDPGELMKLCIENSFLSMSFIREGVKFFYSWLEDLMISAFEACQGTDVLIESPSAMIGVHIAEKLEIPFFRSMPFPFSRTSKFPHPFASQSSVSTGNRIYNDMTYVMIDLALWAGTSRYINRFRRKCLQLPSTTLDRLEMDKVPYIYSFSSSVIAPPKDWPDYIHVTGYWFLDDLSTWAPPAELLGFLDAKDTRPIVYIGFGSIIVPDPAETTRTVIDAVLKSNVRAIICKGWSGRHKEEDYGVLLDQHVGTIYHCTSVPHSWLFDRVQGVVHHGGAGTTAAGLRAGLPTVIKPFFGDQRFWGQHVEELKIGVCITKLTVEALAESLEIITHNTAIINKAKLVGETIRKENGARTAVQCIYRELKYAKQLRCKEHTLMIDEEIESL